MLWAALKEWGIVKGRIPPIWGELDLIDYAKLPKWKAAFQIEDDVFSEVLGARHVAASYVKGDITAVQIREVLSEHSGFLRQMDKRFKIEVCFYELQIDEGAIRLLKAAVKGCLPSGVGKITADVSLARLRQVMQSNLLTFVSPTAQSLATSVQQIVKSLSEQKAPRIGEGNDPFLQECLELYGYYITADVAEKDGAPQTVYGKEAVLKIPADDRSEAQDKSALDTHGRGAMHCVCLLAVRG